MCIFALPFSVYAISLCMARIYVRIYIINMQEQQETCSFISY